MKPRALVLGLLLALAAAGGGAQERTMAIDRTALLLSKAVVLQDLKSVQEAAQETQQEAVDRGGVGPGERSIRLAEQLSVRGLETFGLASLQELTTLSQEVFQDDNLASGIYYYRPRLYFLNWDPEDKYFLTVDYKPEGESNKNVVVDARLTPGAVQSDIPVLKKLLKVYLQGQPASARPPNLDEIQVLPLPARYEARFNWAALGVPAADVAVTGVDRDTGQIGVQLTTDVATKEILIKKLGDPQGLSGDVVIQPQAVTAGRPALAPFTVAARLKLADSEAYANARWRRTPGDHSLFRNEHQFPARLKHLCYLFQNGSELVVRGYDLGGRELRPGDTAKIPNARIHSQIDQPQVVRAWYVYTLQNDSAYRDRVIAGLTGGVGSVPVKRVTIEVVKTAELFAQHHLYKIAVLVRSRYFDPDAAQAIEHTYEFAASDTRREMAPLYAEDGSAPPLYEYKIGVVTEDGEPHQDAAWRQPREGFLTSIFVGSRQVEEVLAE